MASLVGVSMGEAMRSMMSLVQELVVLREKLWVGIMIRMRAMKAMSSMSRVLVHWRSLKVSNFIIIVASLSNNLMYATTTQLMVHVAVVVEAIIVVKGAAVIASLTKMHLWAVEATLQHHPWCQPLQTLPQLSVHLG